MAGLAIENIHKRFGETIALGGVSFEVAEGEIVAVLGPSGCGKSTLLSLVAGLEEIDAGRIIWGGQDMAGVPPHERGFGLMFQDYALFPHKNVYENIAFGLRMLGVADAEIDERVNRILALVGLPGFPARDVNTLSGGEQQRVALARSLAPRPRLLMLDEPLGSLDRALREQLLNDLRQILRQAGQTTLYVTHDQEEAFALADRVVVMRAGQVAQIGVPQEIYDQPNSEFVALFIGLENILEGEAQNGIVETALGQIPYQGIQGKVKLLIRPNAARLDASGDLVLEAQVTAKTFRGGMTRLKVKANGVDLVFEFDSRQELPGVGEKIELGLAAEKSVHVLGE